MGAEHTGGFHGAGPARTNNSQAGRPRLNRKAGSLGGVGPAEGGVGVPGWGAPSVAGQAASRSWSRVGTWEVHPPHVRVHV